MMKAPFSTRNARASGNIAKRASIAASAFAVMISAADVHAQSAVTLYGLVDTAVLYTNNQKGNTAYQMTSGTVASSRWGLKGVEDLGGGLQALFQLENGFSAANGTFGQNGREFGRAAYVGLSSNAYGKITLGRQNDVSSDFLGPLAASNQWAGGLGAHPGDTDNLYVNGRVSNSIKYTSNDLYGFHFSGQYSCGGTAGNFSNNRIWGLGAQYARGPLVIAATYVNASQPNTSLYDGTPGSAATGLNTTPLYAGYASARTLQIAGAGAMYKFGDASLGLLYTNTKFKDLGSPSGALPVARFAGDTATLDNLEADFQYSMTQSWHLAAAYAYTHSHGAGNAHYNQLTLGSTYFLTKRTDVYLLAAWQQASGIDSTGHDATAALWPVAASSNAHQIAAAVGLLHRF